MIQTAVTTCPACGAEWRDGKTCQDDFYQMLFWEAENPALGIVHHLMVLGYHLQHPHLYSSEGLAGAKQILINFVAKGIQPAEQRTIMRESVNSNSRKTTITARPGNSGSYDEPVRWTMTAADVVVRGAENYVESTREWARSIYESLRASGNLAE
jgi:hypothetical protein